MTHEDEKTVDEWATLERQRINDFVEWYKKEHARDYTTFPEKLELGDWDEQFVIFKD